MGDSYHIERIEDGKSLLQLRTPWEALADRLPHSSIFLSWEWVRCWWEHLGRNAQLWLVAIWQGRDLVGLAPLVRVSSGLGPLKVRRLQFAGTGIAYPMHLDVLASPGHEGAVLALLLEHLQTERQAWDLLDLRGLAEGSALAARLAEIGVRQLQGAPMVAPYLPLPREARELYASLPSKRRRELRYYHRRLEHERSGQVAYVDAQDEQEVTRLMSALSRLSRARFEARHTESSFDDEAFDTFMSHLALALHSRGWLRLSALEVGGHPISVTLIFCYHNVYYGYQGTFDTAWARYSPMRLLICRSIEKAIAEGARELDFLCGEGHHKDQWAAHARSEPDLVAAHAPRGHLALGFLAAEQWLRQLAVAHFPPPARERLGAIVARASRRVQRAPGGTTRKVSQPPVEQAAGRSEGP